MRIALGSDHAGFRYKEKVKELLGTIEENRDKKNRADNRVALKKSAIDPGDVEMARAPMFINERHGHEWHRAEINQPELRDKTESDQGDQRGDVQQLCQTKSTRDSES